jgi:SAM-dependent methyltransferase
MEKFLEKMLFRKKFVHVPEMSDARNFRSIVQVFSKIKRCNTVVDVGCGGGGLLRCFKEDGAEVYGLDGPWVDLNLLEINLTKNEFLIVDLESDITLNKKFDLCTCIEVAEHLSEGRALEFIKNLTELSDFVLFSAATKYQGGENHLNEQCHEYWEKLFSIHDYKCYDIFKIDLWNSENTYWWIKQNMVLYVRKGSEVDNLSQYEMNQLRNVIHKDLFDLYADYTRNDYLKRTLKRLYRHLRYRISGRK